jgi:hypothetical protein
MTEGKERGGEAKMRPWGQLLSVVNLQERQGLDTKVNWLRMKGGGEKKEEKARKGGDG